MWKILAQILLFWMYYPVQGCLRIIHRPLSALKDGPVDLASDSPAQLNFTGLRMRSSMENGQTCNDSLEIRIPDNSTEKSALVGRFYGNEITEFQFPYSTQFIMKLNLGNCTTTFNDTYVEFFYTECGRLYTEDSGFIYPTTNLTPSMVCVNRILVKNGDSILLLLLDSVFHETNDTLDCSGQLTVFSNGSYRNNWCVTGSVYIGRIPGKELLVQHGIFKTSSVAETELPFSLFYSACGVTYREPTGKFESPMYPYSHRGQYNCSYIVDPPGSSSISFQLNTILNGNCSKNSIVVRRGISSTGEMLLKLCFTTTNYMLRSNGPVWIEFIKADNFTISSFSLTYTDDSEELVSGEVSTIGLQGPLSIQSVSLIAVIGILGACCVALAATVAYLMHERKSKKSIKSTAAREQLDTVNERYEPLQETTLTSNSGHLYTSLDPTTVSGNTKTPVTTKTGPQQLDIGNDRYESLQTTGQAPNPGELYTPLRTLGPRTNPDHLKYKADGNGKPYVIGVKPDYRLDGSIYENPK